MTPTPLDRAFDIVAARHPDHIGWPGTSTRRNWVRRWRNELVAELERDQGAGGQLALGIDQEGPAR